MTTSPEATNAETTDAANTDSTAVSNFISAATAAANAPGDVDPLAAYLSQYEKDEFADEAQEYLSDEEVAAEIAAQVSPDTTEDAEQNESEANPYAEAEQRLLAREEAVRKQENDFELKVKEAVARRTDFRGKKADEVLKSLGFDPELVLKEMMYERASDTNPVKGKLREELRDIHTKRELDSMRAELESARVVEAQRQYFQSIDSGAREYVTTKVDEKVTPIFAEVAKTKPERAHQRVMQVILEDARERLARGEDGEPLSYADAVKRVEADWSELAGVFRSKKEAAVSNDKKAVTVPVTRPVKTTKPVVKPVTELTVEDEINAGIEKAKKTFYQTEAKARGITKR